MFKTQAPLASCVRGSHGRAKVRVPAAGARSKASYTVLVGKLRSRALALTRRAILLTPTYGAGKVTLSGQILAPLAKPVAAITIRQLAVGSCTQLITVATIRPSANGSFKTTVTPPAGQQAAIYSLTTLVRTSAGSKTTTPAASLALVVVPP